MARNTIQKKFAITEVRGFTIKDGQPEEVVYKIGKKCGLNTAQALIRKEEPCFAAVEVNVHEQIYKMSFEDFKKYGTPCDASGADED